MTTDHDACQSCQVLRDQLAQQELQIQELVATIQNLTRHDTLTGVFNQRVMRELLATELQRSTRTGHPFCFAIIDLDNFGEINETHDRQTGDRVLAMVAQASMKLLRALDRFARIGGDEFGILLPASWLDQGAQAMSRLTQAIGACDWESVVPGRKLTFSGGLTTNAPGDDPEKIIVRAETALRQAKDQGKNRIVELEQPLPPLVPDEDF